MSNESAKALMAHPSMYPYHLFDHEGQTYLINVKDMTATIVDETTAKTLQAVHAPSAAVPEQRIVVERDPHPIVNLCLFLTQSCNLHCVYCYGDGGTYGTGGNMSEETAFQAVDWLIQQSRKMRQIHIGFFGGEPFLRFPLMKSIVDYAKQRAKDTDKEVSFQATSNATLLDDEVIAFIKAEEITVLVSFDGPKEIQDAQRPYANGDGSYDATVPKVKKLLKAIPKTPCHAVLVGDTDPKLIREALQEIGFTEISLIPASESLFTDNQAMETRVRDTQQLMKDLEEQSQMWLDGIRSRDVKALKDLSLNSELYPAIVALLHNIKRRHACNAGLSMVAVSSVGDVYLCHRFVGQDEYKLGSVFQTQLNRQEYQKSPTVSNEICSTCFAKYYCAGGCKHDNAAARGSIALPAEELCRLRCREFELGAIIVSNLSADDKAFLVAQDICPPKPCPLDF